MGLPYSRVKEREGADWEDGRGIGRIRTTEKNTEKKTEMIVAMRRMRGWHTNGAGEEDGRTRDVASGVDRNAHKLKSREPRLIELALNDTYLRKEGKGREGR